MSRTFRNISAVASKELRGYFVSPVAWVMMGLFALIFGVFFTAHLGAFVAQSMQSQFGGEWHLLSSGAFLLMIVPLIVFFALQRYFVQGLLAGSVK